MLSIKKKQSRPGPEIHLSKRLDNGESWPSDEDIDGYAIYKLAPGVDFSNSKITLKGVVTTTTGDNPQGSLQRKWRTEKLPFIGVALNSKPRPEFKADDGTVKIPFRFNLEECQRQSPIVSNLPPSLKSKDEGKWWAGLSKYELDSQFEIVYSITASFYSSRGLAASSTRTIPILPVSQAQPPVSSADFPSEYFFAATAPHQAKARFIKSSGPRIEVAGEEPEPMLLDPHDTSTHGLTEVPFVIKALPQSSGVLELSSLPTQCQLKAHLVTKTLVTADRMPNERIIPTLEQARYGEDSYLRLEKSDEQSFTVAIPQWSHYTPNSTEQFTISRFSFLFKLLGDKLHNPTFFTPLLSRRYAIDITLSFPTTSSPDLKLSLPLQIVYGAPEVKHVKPN